MATIGHPRRKEESRAGEGLKHQSYFAFFTPTVARARASANDGVSVGFCTGTGIATAQPVTIWPWISNAGHGSLDILITR